MSEYYGVNTVVQTPSTKRRVLVVDENRDAADSLALILGQMGHEVRVSYDSREAIEVARSLGPDIVFLDLVMPGIDGYEVARQMRSDPQLQHALIVAVTGFGGEEDRERSRKAGIDHHVVKPIDLEFIESLLGRRR
jgi:CheY-like chemotaxis protein